MIIQEQSQKTKLWTIILQNINNIRDLKLEYEDTKNIYIYIYIYIYNLIIRKPVPKHPEYKIPIINI